MKTAAYLALLGLTEATEFTTICNNNLDCVNENG